MRELLQMDLTDTDRRQLEFAVGYLELDAPALAHDELAKIAPAMKGHPDVLMVSLEIFTHARNWSQCVEIACHLVQVQPDNPQWPVSFAYATRRAVSLEAAHVILHEAEGRFPKDATIKFNLGCYAAQMGELDAAKQLVQQAIELDPSFQKAAREDPDLEPIRERLTNT